MAKPSSKSIPEQIPVDGMADSAYKVSTEDVRRNFNEEELTKLKDELFQKNKEAFERSELKKAIDGVLNKGGDIDTLKDLLEGVTLKETGINPLKQEITKLIRTTSKGYEIAEQKLYGFDFQDVNRMAFYDEHGLFVYDRPLTEQEKQTSIISMARTGTNG